MSKNLRKQTSLDQTDAFILASVCPADGDLRLGGIATAQEILKSDPRVGSSNIAAACAIGDARTVAKLLRQDPLLATAPGGPRNWPPLLYVCYSRFLRLQRGRWPRFVNIAKLLLKHGADANSFFMSGTWRETALYGAAGVANCPPLTRVLLAAGALVTNPPDEETLYHAVEFSDNAALKCVLKKMPKGDWLNYCTLHKMDMEDAAGLKLLLDHGADMKNAPAGPGIRARYPLHFAIDRQRSGKIIAMLLKAGAQLHEPNADGVTPMELAQKLGHVEAIRMLGAAGAKKRTDDRLQLIEAIMAGNRTGALKLVQSIPDFAETLTAEEHQLLPRAADAGNERAVRLLLELGWPLETRGPWGGTALHHAAFNGHASVAKLLLKRGARVDLKNDFGGDALGAALHGIATGNHRRGKSVLRPLLPHDTVANLSRRLKWARDLGDKDLVKLLEAAMTAAGKKNADNKPSCVDASLTRDGGLSYLEIPALDPQRSARFYQQLFGWKIEGLETPHPKFIDKTGHLLGRWIAHRPISRKVGMLPYFYVNRIQETVPLAESLGGEIVKPIYPEGNLLVAVIRDPAGNAIGLWQENAGT